MVAVATAALFAVGCGLLSYALDLWPRLESATIDARFALRGGTGAPSDVVIVAIDDRSFNVLRHQWPFPRRWDAKVIDTLHAAGARAIAYDVQFTEPTDPTDDNALFGAVARARNVVLATTEVDPQGQTNVLGGTANLRAADAVAAAANLPPSGGGVVRRYAYSMLGLPSFAVAAARAGGQPIARSQFPDGTALIDFRGPAGTIRQVSFADVLDGHFDPRTFAGKIVVVGATAPTLQDLHQTASTTSNPMSGAEVQANAIWTALHGNPLRSGPGWLAVVAILFCGLLAPLGSLRCGPLRSFLLAFAAIAGYLALAQLLFDADVVLAVSYPLAAGTLGTVGMLAASYVAAAAERNAVARLLSESQLELLQRLAQAVESRDPETGEHTLRIGMLCQGLALELGWSAAEARQLMHASIVHDIGKIAIPDSILLKPGPLNAAEWETMRRHPTIGAQLLQGSANPLVQLAETIARTHHERWDGTGYPDGLAGEAIPEAGRICAVVDVYDALVSSRPYKQAWPVQDALAELERGSATQFDPAVVAAFMRLAPRLEGVLRESHTREQAQAALRPAAA